MELVLNPLSSVTLLYGYLYRYEYLSLENIQSTRMCQKIREPYFRMIATALIVAFAATANAACTTDNQQTMSDCVAKLTMPTNVTAKDEMCPYYKDFQACYPKCYCDDDTPAVKDAIAAVEKRYKDLRCSGEAECVGSENRDPTNSGSDMKDTNSAGTCASDEATRMSECINMLSLPIDVNKDKSCSFYRGVMGCNPT